MLSIFLPGQDTSLLENLCAVTLYRKYYSDTEPQIYYYNKNIEVDFFIPDKAVAIQVSYSIKDSDTRKREIRALESLHKLHPLKEAFIITYDEEENITSEKGLAINVVPVWKWVLL